MPEFHDFVDQTFSPSILQQLDLGGSQMPLEQHEAHLSLWNQNVLKNLVQAVADMGTCRHVMCRQSSCNYIPKLSSSTYLWNQNYLYHMSGNIPANPKKLNKTYYISGKAFQI